jgi:hypothetical protein
MLSEVLQQMITKFQCSGCIHGSDVYTCKEAYLPNPDLSPVYCLAWVPGTTMCPGGKIALGLPKGFNKTGMYKDVQCAVTKGPYPCYIRLWENKEHFLKMCFYGYDKLNVAVWAMEQNGYLFVRCFCPRINTSYIDIIKDGKKSELAPLAIDPSTFYSEID